MTLHFSKIAMTLKLSLPEEAIARHVVATPSVVAEHLASQVIEYLSREKLNYVPALDYFYAIQGIDPELIEALKNISWVVTTMVRNEIGKRLRPIMSSIKFENIQTPAFSIPAIRPGDNNFHHRLVEHYSPNTVKVNIIGTLIQRFPDNEVAEKMARSMASRWLTDEFESFEITATQVLS
jgi:hypothetical protein